MPDEQGENRNNLGQFEKGKSGNPGGRPKGSVGMTKRIRELLLSDSGGGKPVADVLAEVLVREAIKNPAKMWRFIQETIDRDEGVMERNVTPLVHIDLSGKVPEAPPMESGEDGAPSLAVHLSTLMVIAKERGLVLPGELAEVVEVVEESKVSEDLSKQ